jgi:hypothetical protein
MKDTYTHALQFLGTTDHSAPLPRIVTNASKHVYKIQALRSEHFVVREGNLSIAFITVYCATRGEKLFEKKKQKQILNYDLNMNKICTGSHGHIIMTVIFK